MKTPASSLAPLEAPATKIYDLRARIITILFLIIGSTIFFCQKANEDQAINGSIRRSIFLSAAEQTPLSAYLEDRANVIQGRVLNSSGLPIPGVTVKLFDLETVRARMV